MVWLLMDLVGYPEQQKHSLCLWEMQKNGLLEGLRAQMCAIDLDNLS